MSDYDNEFGNGDIRFSVGVNEVIGYDSDNILEQQQILDGNYATAERLPHFPEE